MCSLTSAITTNSKKIFPSLFDLTYERPYKPLCGHDLNIATVVSYQQETCSVRPSSCLRTDGYPYDLFLIDVKTWDGRNTRGNIVCLRCGAPKENKSRGIRTEGVDKRSRRALLGYMLECWECLPRPMPFFMGRKTKQRNPQGSIGSILLSFSCVLVAHKKIIFFGCRKLYNSSAKIWMGEMQKFLFLFSTSLMGTSISVE